MTKWTGPLAPPPFWLLAGLEVTAEMEPPKLKKAVFVLKCILALIVLGCTPAQAFEIAANTMNETGWGRFYRAWNLGGWKIWKFSSTSRDGTPRQWSRALGNKSSGDPQTCFYRAFASLEAFYAEWLLTFVPKVDPGKKPNGRYWKTGQQFWAGEPWFDDLIEAGYKGEVTRQNPENSIEAHESIVKTMSVYYAQHLLGVDADGDWGQKSRNACSAFQLANQLKLTGELNAETTAKLFTT